MAPEQIKRIQASLNTKIAQWKHERVDECNAQVREYNAAQGTALPTLGKDGKLNFPDEN